MTDLKFYRRLEYAKIDGISLTLDLYVPGSNKPLPVVVWLHQGGLRDRTSYVFGPPLMDMVSRGYAIAQATYRLSTDVHLCEDPQTVRFPAMLQDVKTVVRFLRARAEEYNLDPNRIGIAGDSAGGQLSAMMAVTAGRKEFETELYSGYSSRVRCAVDFYGPAEFLTMDEQAELGPVRNPNLIHNAPDSPESLAVGGPIQENQALAKAASTVTYVTPEGDKSVPLLIFHGDHDPNVPYQQSVTLYEKLKACGYNAAFYSMPGYGHNLAFFEEVKSIVFDFFDQYMK